jgi:cobalamin synthase
VLSAALVLLLAPRPGLVSWGAVVAATFVTGAIARRRLGGVTGDVLGANVEICEAGALVAAVFLAKANGGGPC